MAPHALANHNLGALAIKAGRTADALPCFEAALRAAPGQEITWQSYVAALAGCRRWADARKALAQARSAGCGGAALDALEERLPREPSGAEMTALKRAFDAGAFAELKQAARALTEAYPGSALGWKALGLSLVATGRWQEALPPLERSIGLKADDPEVFLYLAATCRELGLLDHTETSYKRALELRPGAVEAHLGLGRLLFRLDRFAEAERHLRRVIDATPGIAEWHMNLGATLEKLGRFDEAEACFRKALSLEPDNPICHYNLGNFLREADRLDEAEATYRRALELDSGNVYAWNNLAETLVERGRHSDALGSKIVEEKSHAPY